MGRVMKNKQFRLEQSEMSRKIILLIFFFLIGFSGLVYEVIWSRQLSLVFGSTVYALSVTLASFMAGLGLGSLYFGKVADRSKNPERLLALFQIITGISAFLITIVVPLLNSLYPAVLNYTYPPFFIISLLSFIFSFILILIPTFLIGGSFPLMVRIYTEDLEETSPGLGLLYGVNTFGAVIGVFLSSFFLIGTIGIKRTAFLASGINLLIGLLLLSLQKLLVAEPVLIVEGPKDRQMKSENYQLWLVVIGLSGFAGLGYEVIWTRILSIIFQNTVYSFALILTAFLSGITLGSFCYSKIHPRKRSQISIFVLLEAILGLYVIILALILPELPALLLMIMGKADLNWTSALIFQFSTILLLMMPATTIMGVVFPLTVSILTEDSAIIGQSSGLVYGANTIGALLGSLVTGFLLLPGLGVHPGTKVMAFLNILISLIILTSFRLTKKYLTITIGTISCLTIFFSLIKNNIILPPSIRLGLGPKFKLLYYKETAPGTVTVIEDKATGVRSCYVNNSAVCGTTYDALKAVRLLGSLPMLLHRNPKKVLVIGYGLGITASTISQFPIEKLDCIEICPSVIEAARYFIDFNQNVLQRPEARLIKGDGRNFLLLSPEKYDVISCDPTHPLLGSGSLYTREYFALCRQRLNPDGITCQYLPLHKTSLKSLEAIIRAFCEIFPNSTIWLAVSHGILLGQIERSPIDYKVLRERMENAKIKKTLESVNLVTPEELLSAFIMDQAAVKKFVNGSKANTDDFPFVEFSGSQSLGEETWSTNMTALLNFRSDVGNLITSIDEKKRENSRQWQKGKFLMYQGIVSIRRGLIREAFQDFYQGLNINPADQELRLIMESISSE